MALQTRIQGRWRQSIIMSNARNAMAASTCLLHCALAGYKQVKPVRIASTHDTPDTRPRGARSRGRSSGQLNPEMDELTFQQGRAHVTLYRTCHTDGLIPEQMNKSDGGEVLAEKKGELSWDKHDELGRGEPDTSQRGKGVRSHRCEVIKGRAVPGLTSTVRC